VNAGASERQHRVRSVAARLAEDIGELQGVELEHGEIVARVFVHVMADGPGRLADTWEV
jgi:hypothetical protein